MEEESRFKVLLVDDEKSNLDILHHLLMDKHQVFIAKNGHTGLKQAREVLPDIILLDIIMPDLDGFEVITELKRHNETANIPVIFITTVNGVEDEERGFLLGAVDYITKPFVSSIVKARVNTHLQIVKQIRTIERLGMVDALTEIPNRRCFDMQLMSEWGRAIREMMPLSLILVDIDDFKSYNETYGHPQGNILLQTMAKMLVKALKRMTDLVARVDSGKFAALLPNTDRDGAVVIAEDIRAYAQAMKVPCPGRDAPNSVTVSIGVASRTPTIESSMNDFIAAAEGLRRKARDTGGNRILA